MQYVRVCSTETIMQDFDIKCLELNISENNQTQSYKCCTSGVRSVEADSQPCTFWAQKRNKKGVSSKCG